MRPNFFTSSWVPAAENMLGEVSTGLTSPPVLYFASKVVLVWVDPGLLHFDPFFNQWVCLSVLWLLLEVD